MTSPNIPHNGREPGPGGKPPWFTKLLETLDLAYRLIVIPVTLVGLIASAIRIASKSTSELPFGILAGQMSFFGWLSIALLISAFIIGVVILSQFTIRIFKAPKSDKGLLFTCRDAIVETYDSRRFLDLYNVQAGLRAWLVMCVLAVGIGHIGRAAGGDDIQIHPIIRGAFTTHVVATAIYLMLTAVLYRTHRKRLEAFTKAAGATNSDLDFQVGRIFWEAARLDLLYVTVIWASAISVNHPFHLGYIIPMLGTWLFFGSHAKKAVMLVFCGLVARAGALAYIDWVAPSLNVISGRDFGLLKLLFSVLADGVFWATVVVLLAIVRHLRFKAKQRAERAEVARAEEALLRKHLEALGTQQRQAVFAKNTLRQFIFANEVLLKDFAGLAVKNGWPLENGRARWEDICLKTDKDLGMPARSCERYRMSDSSVLETGESYEDFEPSFDPATHGGPVIWTSKSAVRDADGKVLGLVGFVKPGLPVEMQQMCEYLTNNLPIYVSMKDSEGHIVWANERHLKTMENRLDELIRKSGLSLGTNLTLQEKLRSIRNGHGPTDEDLYGEAGRRYSQRDQEIMGLARTHHGSLDEFESLMDELIVKWFGANRDGRFPKKGWMEHHRFPTGEAKWVEVWKMPWWGKEREESGTREVRGILVFFIESDKTHLRRSVVWRWVNRHLSNALSANAALLNSVPVNNHSAAVSELALPRLLLRGLRWFKALVDGKESEIEPSIHRRNLKDLGAVLEILAESANVPARIEFSCPADFEFEMYGDELFVVVISLAMNAIEAVERSGKPGIVKVTAKQNGKYIHIEVADDGSKLSEEDLLQINALKRPNQQDSMPGGGFYLSQRLAQHLCGSFNLPGNECPVRIDSRADGMPGAVASVVLPIAIFQKARRKVHS